MSVTGPSAVEIYEVGPRDGLQNESTHVPLEAKVELVERLAEAHPSGIEVTSFVRPDRIPALADADDLAEQLRGRPWRSGEKVVPLVGLVPNRRGFERLVAGGLDRVAVFLSASEGHNQANLQSSVAQSLEHVLEVMHLARDRGIPVRAYVSSAFGCPFEGKVPAEKVLELVQALNAEQPRRIAISDTLGVAEPRQVRSLCESAIEIVGEGRLGLHMHDTYGTALANVFAGWQAGVSSFDGAVGGTGGCPYAPGAAGNLATEDAVQLFERMGVDTGVKLDELVAAGRFLEGVLGRTLPGRALRALSAQRGKYCHE